MLCNTIYNEDCLETMQNRLCSESIDLVVTSPPYDNLRKYKGYSFDFEATARGLWGIIKPGGVIVWVVGDQTYKGSESGTSFRQALYFKSIGFSLHDTMIYKKHPMPTDPRIRYYQRFEYMFIFSKGFPSSYTPIADIPSSKRKQCNGTDRRGDTLIITDKKWVTPDFSIRGNIWEYDCRNKETDHPASFPVQLAKDHIVSWSKKEDIVYDPFMGSGTTAKAAIELDRFFVGSEISEDYCQMSYDRLGTGHNT